MRDHPPLVSWRLRNHRSGSFRPLRVLLVESMMGVAVLAAQRSRQRKAFIGDGRAQRAAGPATGRHLATRAQAWRHAGARSPYRTVTPGHLHRQPARSRENRTDIKGSPGAWVLTAARPRRQTGGARNGASRATTWRQDRRAAPPTGVVRVSGLLFRRRPRVLRARTQDRVGSKVLARVTSSGSTPGRPGPLPAYLQLATSNLPSRRRRGHAAARGPGAPEIARGPTSPTPLTGDIFSTIATVG